MAASSGRKSRPHGLKLIEGRGNGKDSGGRDLKPPPGFTRLPPEKPDGMSPTAADLWDRIVPELQRLQVTKPIDGPALEMLCETYARWHAARDMRLDAERRRVAFESEGKYVEMVLDSDGAGLLGRNSQGWTTAPWVGVEERAAKEFRAWCSEFGLTPAAESKIGGGGDDADDNPFGGG
jgi:P27 family predicted phage terminase small subunit